MPLSMRPRVIQVDRGSRGFGLSLIYRGLDKFPENETGIFVARVVPGGQAQKYGVKENDKIISINNKTPRNVDDAVQIIKEAGKAIKLVVVRQEDVPGVSRWLPWWQELHPGEDDEHANVGVLEPLDCSKTEGQEQVFIKNTFDGFFETGLHDYLQ